MWSSSAAAEDDDLQQINPNGSVDGVLSRSATVVQEEHYAQVSIYVGWSKELGGRELRSGGAAESQRKRIEWPVNG